MRRVYLCGPIAGCTDSECKDWRESIKKFLPGAVDPLRRDYRDKHPATYDVKEIVEQDKLDIMSCDGLIVNYDRHSTGTAMEILFAWEQHKKIIVVVPRGMPISPWLKYHATGIVHSLAEAIAAFS